MISIVKMNRMGIDSSTLKFLFEFEFDNSSTLPEKAFAVGSKTYLIANGSTAQNIITSTRYEYNNGKWVKLTTTSEDTTNTDKITDNGNYSFANNDSTGFNDVIVDVTGSGGGSQLRKDVNFYDYDGTIVNSYTATEFTELSAMPDNPTHEGLTAQGWNWSLTDAKNYVSKYSELNIGQMYVTNDGKTRLYITLIEGRTSPILQLYLNENSELDIDWGDNSTHSTFTSTDAAYKSERHNYSAPGDYVISISVTTGSFELKSSSSSISSILWNGNNSAASPDYAYNNSIMRVEVGTGVKCIGQYAFQNCNLLTSVTLPSSLITIDKSAFQNCMGLYSITIPNVVESIEGYTFSNCYSLYSVSLPNSLTAIKYIAFKACYALNSITIPGSVTSIGPDAFQLGSALRTLTIPESVTSLGEDVFQSSSSLTSIIIPSSVTSISTNTFRNCSALISVKLPDTLTNIGNFVFYGDTALASITIPANVTSIGTSAFYNCSYMSYIKFESTTPPTVSNSNTWQNVSTSTKILVPINTYRTYTATQNYPSPSSYLYLVYGTYTSEDVLPTTTTDNYNLTWYTSMDDAASQTNPITTGNGEEVYARCTPIV